MQPCNRTILAGNKQPRRALDDNLVPPSDTCGNANRDDCDAPLEASAVKKQKSCCRKFSEPWVGSKAHSTGPLLRYDGDGSEVLYFECPLCDEKLDVEHHQCTLAWLRMQSSLHSKRPRWRVFADAACLIGCPRGTRVDLPRCVKEEIDYYHPVPGGAVFRR